MNNQVSPTTTMNRRKALKQASLVLGYAITGPTLAGVINGCGENRSLNWQPQFLTQDEVLLVEAACERILPSGNTPGATDAMVVKFVDQMVAEFYLPEDQQYFSQGLEELKAQSQSTISKNFVDASPSQQDQLIQQQAEAAKVMASDGSKHFFLMLKELTILGFFTSEVGATQVLNYDEIPGGFQGCQPLDSVGGKTWAT